MLIDSQEIDDIILKYYLDKAEYNIAENIPEKYKPNNWINTADTLIKDFASFIREMLRDVDNGSLTYPLISIYSRNLYSYCLLEKGIVIDEVEKTDKLFSTLFTDCFYEIDELGNPYCNTTRKLIDIMLEMILSKDNILAAYDTNIIEREYIYAARFMPDSRVINYLINNLNSELDEHMVSTIIYSLAENQAAQSIDTVRNVYVDRFKGNVSIEADVISFAMAIQSYESLQMLESIKEYLAEDERNLYSYDVALCKLQMGEQGLIRLFTETDSYLKKIDIIDCYKYFRSKDFARMLLNGLNDKTRLENGYFPVIENSYFTIKKETCKNLIKWFGVDILDYIERKRIGI